LIELKAQALRCSKHIKRAIGISIPQDLEKESVNSIKLLSRVLSLLGLKLKRVKQTANRPVNRIRVYQIDPAALYDGRQAIFEIWLSRDALNLETAATAGFYIPESDNWNAPYKYRRTTYKVGAFPGPFHSV